MKIYLIALLAALPLAAQAETRDVRTMAYGRNVTLTTEITTLSPALCAQQFDHQIDQQGSHEHIYRTAESDRAVVIVCQRQNERSLVHSPSVINDVKITMWKAVVRNGKTVTEKRVYHLSPFEVNEFLDGEFTSAAQTFAKS